LPCSEYLQYKITQRIFSTGPYGDEHLLFSIDYHLESGSTLSTTCQWETTDISPALAEMPILPNQCTTGIPGGYDYLFSGDCSESLDFSYPQYPDYGLPPIPQTIYYSNL
jgi:hypothetical protein